MQSTAFLRRMTHHIAAEDSDSDLSSTLSLGSPWEKPTDEERARWRNHRKPSA